MANERPYDVSLANNASEVAASANGALGILIDADIQANDGTLIPAVEAQVVRTYLGGLVSCIKLTVDMRAFDAHAPLLSKSPQHFLSIRTVFYLRYVFR